METRGDPEVTGTPSKRKRRSTAAASPAAASPAAACGSQASTSSATTAAELSAEKPRKLTAAQRALQEAADAAAPAAGPPAEGSPTATLIVRAAPPHALLCCSKRIACDSASLRGTACAGVPGVCDVELGGAAE